MNTIDYLELIQKKHKVKGKPCSDYRAAQLLGIGRSAISRYKTENRQMDDDTAIKTARLLEISPEKVLTDMQIERAKEPELKEIWTNIRRALSANTASIALAVILSPALYNYAAISDTCKTGQHEFNIMLNYVLPTICSYPPDNITTNSRLATH